MGRPKLEIDAEQVEKLAAIDCSLAEMASILNCDVKTLTNRFSQVIQKGRDSGKSSLKRKQFEIAMKGNVTMLIWLGKIRLGQQEIKDPAQYVSIQMPPDLEQIIRNRHKKKENAA